MLSNRHRDRYQAAVYKWLSCAQQHGIRLHCPAPSRGARLLEGGHSHFHPELFLQLGGATEFRFPHETIRLPAGEALLVPRKMPHAETAHHWRGTFRNLVIMFPRDGVTLHTGVRTPSGKPRSQDFEYFKTGKGHQIARYLDDIEALQAGATQPESEEAMRSLLQAVLAYLRLVMVQDDEDDNPKESAKVRECRFFVISHLHDPHLSVKYLASRLQCSADYLSHLFAVETGKRLTDFILQERMAMAKQNLANPTLSIKEIAWSCGFADPGYFTRLFKRVTGLPPRTFRQGRNACNVNSFERITNSM
ncbi:MAG TPA: AraC family transcriptional regulator [Verrucomicrobia bacterium]|nr:AraC family transcriptional regulator [Verrucomicrobiota bacterium]